MALRRWLRRNSFVVAVACLLLVPGCFGFEGCLLLCVEKTEEEALLAITEPTDGAVITGGGYYQVQATRTGEPKLTTIDVYVDGTLVKTLAKTTQGTGPYGGGSYELTGTPRVFVIKAVGRDASGAAVETQEIMCMYVPPPA